MARRAALVIGVDKTGGGMPPLQSAAAGALEVAAWLRDEGYDVVELTDAAGPLHASRVKEELKTLVTYPATLDQLVVYFSGHGIRTAKVDRWLFSDAPGDTSDAINLHGAMTAAQYSGIPTVVFVSDACRSVPDGMFGEVTGIDAFPNLPVDTPSKVDVVRGAGRNQEAYEAVIPAEYGGDDSVRSVLTYALRSAYLNPPPEMTREIIVDGIEVTVVPNRRLEGYLQPRVDEILTGINVNLIQNLEINIPSPDEVFIARAAVGPDGPSGPYRSGGLERSPRRTIMDFGADRYTSVIDRLPENEQEVSKRNPRHDLLDHLESKCGFTVTGAEVDRVACTSGENGAWAEILPTSEPGSSIVRVWDVAPAVSTVIRLEDGRSTVIPALHGYIGHVSVDDDGVIAVSYVPVSDDWRYIEYQERASEIDRSRSMVALSIDDNRLVVRDDGEQPDRLANEIRMGKAFDPALGVYAALAYSQAGLDDQVESLLYPMQADLGTSIFDVVLLASRRVDPQEWPMVPFCPVLTQNWSAVRPRQFELNPILEPLQSHLLNSLWTTFGPGVGDTLLVAVENGELQ